MNSAFHSKPDRRRAGALFIFALALLLVAQLSISSQITPAARLHPLDDLTRLPLAFTPNEGQTDSSVRYAAHQGGGTLLFRQSEVTLLPDPESSSKEVQSAAFTTRRPQPSAITMTFVGANPEAAIQDGPRLPGKANYLRGNNPATWHVGLPTFGAITYRSLYQGIDVRYSGTGRQLDSEITVAPQGDVESIRFSFSSDRGSVVVPASESDGSLAIISQPALTLQPPIAWQEVGPLRIPVLAGYVPSTDGSVSLRLTAYDKTRPLHITNSLIYSTYLGGSGHDNAFMIAVDNAGSAFVTGITMSTDFPIVNPLQSQSTYDSDIFVSKLNPAGTALAYSTYLGGNGHEEGWGIAVDAFDNLYLGGYTTSTDFPTANAFQPSNHGGQDAFLSKLNPSGSALVYSTYLGGSSDDRAFNLALNGTTAYLAGQTSSSDFPTAHALQPANQGGGDIFITRFNASGAGLVFSTYLGGTQEDTALGIATDAAGNAYICGNTTSGDFPMPRGNVYLPYERGGLDAVVAKVSADGSTLDYSTYLGGSADDDAWALAVTPDGRAIATGGTSSDDFPTRHAVQAAKGVERDAFVSELSSTGSWLVYSTFLGGNGDNDAVYGAALDASGNVYVSGITNSTDFPVINAAQPQNAGDSDGFVSELGPNGGHLLFSTYLGGSAADWAWGMAVDSQRNIYTTGATESSDFNTANPLQPQSAGNEDNIVAKFAATSGPTPSPAPCTVGFNDVPPGSPFYQYIESLACDDIISGYDDNTFRPNSSISRGQLTKMVSNSSAYNDPIPDQIYQDAPVSSTFALYIGRLAFRGTVAGYPCGSNGEPCIPPNNMPYFHPTANVTRGQSAKIVGATAGLPTPAPGSQTFEDVPPGSAFYVWVEEMGAEGLVSGYPCGGASEPCVLPLNRPYFRTNAQISRGQAAKIVAQTYYGQYGQARPKGAKH